MYDIAAIEIGSILYMQLDQIYQDSVPVDIKYFLYIFLYNRISNRLCSLKMQPLVSMIGF